MLLLVLFVWFDFLRPINNLSVIKGRVFLGWTSTKLGLMFLLKDTTQWRRWGSYPRPFGLESSTLPLSHCAPIHICTLCFNILLLLPILYHTYCKFGNFREGFIFTKLRKCEVSWKLNPWKMVKSLSFIDVGKSCPSCEFLTWQIKPFNAIRENCRIYSIKIEVCDRF